MPLLTGVPIMHVEFTPTSRILRGLDQIAAYLHVHRRTARRWITDRGLPAMRYPSHAYLTSTALVDLWVLTCGKQARQRDAKDLEAFADIEACFMDATSNQ